MIYFEKMSFDKGILIVFIDDILIFMEDEETS